jgi:hypothetical protein
MKKALSILTAVFLISSCGKEKMEEGKELKAQDDLSNLPQWVLNPEVEDGVAAVGIAQASRGGIQYQIPRAELDAKAKIAAKIQSEISQVTKRALRESNVNNVNDVEEVFSQATKEVVKDMPMSGVRRINIFKDSDGTLYVHMVLKNDDYSPYIQNSQKIYEQRLRNANLGRDNLNKAQEAVKSMFDELEEERKK